MDLIALLGQSRRSLLRNPGYALLVLATLAVGIGGTTAVFGLVHGVLLRPLPYEDPDALVTVDVTSISSGFGISLSIPHYRDWEEADFFAQVGASAGWSYVETTAEGARVVGARAVLGDFFPLLGMEVALGRTLDGSETRAGAAPRVVLGHGFWERNLGADPDILGRTLTLDGRPFEVVGVLAQGQGYPRADVDLYTPMGEMSGQLPWDDRGSSFGTRALARLAPGIGVVDAQAGLDGILERVNADAGANAIRGDIRTLEELFLADVRPRLHLLLAAVLLVLLIAGANAANLALARGEGRSRELAVRRALGADDSAVAGLLATESLWLGLLGGVLGVGLALLLVEVVPARLPMDIPALVQDRIAVNGPVLAFALAVSLGAAILFGLVPTLDAWRGSDELRGGARNTGSRSSRRFRDGLVVTQVALSMTLLVGAGLLLRSLDALSSVDKGFDDQGVVTAELAVPRGHFSEMGPWLDFYDQVVAGIEADPGVQRASPTLLLPLSGSSWEQRVRAEAGPERVEEQPSFLFNIVGEGYFETMGIPLLRGRGFTPADGPDAPAVAVVDQRMAERFWPGEDPLGRQVSWATTHEGDRQWRTVVGVATNIRHYELQSPSRIQGYLPMRQADRYAGLGMAMAVRARGDAGPVITLIREEVTGLDPAIPVTQERLLSDVVADQLGSTRALSVVTTLFGVLAALLAALGLFGVLTLSVARRTRELGVRMALGASPGEVAARVAGQAFLLTAVGAGVGTAGALLAGRVLQAFLYQVPPVDPLSFLAAGAVLLAATAAAVARPALRAASTTPGQILQDE